MTYEMSPEDWEDAKEALEGKPNGTTLSKYPIERGRTEPYKVKWLQLRKHTVVIIDGVLYALSKKEDCRPLVQGNLTFREGLSQQGKKVVIQIKNLYPKSDFFIEPIKKETNNTDSFGFREKNFNAVNHLRIPSKEYGKPIFPKQKVYSLVNMPSRELIESLQKNQTLSPLQKKIASLRICLLMQELHDKGVLYRNITADNFDLTIDNLDIQAKFTNLMFCHFADNKHTSLMLDWPKLMGFMSPEMYSNQCFTVFSDYFSLAIMLFFQIDISGKDIPRLYFDKYINEVCKTYESSKSLINPIEWIKSNKIDIEPELKEILFGMLHPNTGERKGINHLIVYLCEKLLFQPEIKSKLREELESLIHRFKPVRPTLIFSPFQVPDIFASQKGYPFSPYEPNLRFNF